MKGSRPSWREVQGVVETGLDHFGDDAVREWSPAEQLAVALALDVFPSELRIQLIGLVNRLPEAEVLLAQDPEYRVRRALAGEAGNLTPSAELLLAQDDDVRIVTAVARAKFLADQTQSAIKRSNHRIALLTMLRSVENLDEGMLAEWARELVAGTAAWDSAVAGGIIHQAAELCQRRDSLDHLVELLRNKVDESGDTDAWEQSEHEVLQFQWDDEDAQDADQPSPR